jgi:hypothetical protein
MISQDLIFLQAEHLRKSATDRGPWRHAVRDLLVENGIDRRLINVTYDEVSVHKPSNDGATGPLGHLGTCIWRIT